MKIEKLKINSYGKLKNSEINLNDGINVIYGKNEAGKSTLLKFIQNMFYGTSKNKKGKSFSDYDLYKPWVGEDFSGKIEYTLDSGEKIEVYREFGKKNPKIYNDKMEDISKNYNINKNTGNEFFYEQTKVDEFMFLSSIVSMQKEVNLNMQDQNVYIQKLANLASTGDDSVSFKKAMDKLNKKQVDEIGTDRTTGKPINILKKNIESYESQIQTLSKYKQSKFEIEDKEQELENKIQKNKYISNLIKDLQQIKQQERIEEEKIKLNSDILEKNKEKIVSLQKELKNEEHTKVKEEKATPEKKKSNLLYWMIIILLCIITVVSFVITKNTICLGMLAVPALLVLVLLINKSKTNKKINSQKQKDININAKIDERINILKNQINILEKSNDELSKQIECIKQNMQENVDTKKENLKIKYLYKIDTYEMNNLLKALDLTKELNNIEEKLHADELKLNMISLEKKNITNNLEDLASIEEKLEAEKEEYNELLEKNDKINKAREFLQIAYENMKNSVTPKFTANLSSNIEKISNGKYKEVSVNDVEGMIVALPNGEYVSIDKLSAGTIEQLYLSLRLSMVKDISEENMPIILDEAFAYYDDDRLKNVLEFLADNFKENQIILCTCTHREENILKELNLKYNKITLD